MSASTGGQQRRTDGSGPQNRFWLLGLAVPWFVAAALGSCAFTPPPIALSHHLPSTENPGRNHASVAGGVATCEPGCGIVLGPLQASYLRRLGDAAYLGVSQSLEVQGSYPQTLAVAGVELDEGLMLHGNAGVGWYGDSLSAAPKNIYVTQGIGARYRPSEAPFGFYVDPVLAASFPLLEATDKSDAYGFAMVNGGIDYQPNATLRLSFGPTVGRAQPTDLSGGLFFGAVSLGTTLSF